MSTATTAPRLSVILPCFRAAPLAVQSTATLAAFLDDRWPDWEIVVVDDGGDDFNATPLPADPRVALLHHARNLGKGAAVRTGMLAASGRTRIYTDVDLPYDLDLLLTLEQYVRQGFHLAVGDRTMPGSQYATATTSGRRVLSGLASSFIGSLVTGGFHDTQCGIKALRGDVADALFSLVTINGFAFDVEVIYLALKHHLDIKRVPVQLRHNDSSSVRLLHDSIRSLVDILGIKVRQLRGQYHSPALLEIVTSEAKLARQAGGSPSSR